MADIENEVEVETEAPESLRDTLTRAWEEAETPAEEKPVAEAKPDVAPEATPLEAQPQADGRVRDETGRFVKGAKAKRAMETPAPDGPKDMKVAPLEGAAPAQPKPFDRPPASLPVELRDGWRNVDPKFREYVHKREGEVTAALRETAQSREFVQAFQAAAAPFQHVIAAEGSQPLKSFASYLQTAQLMRFGTPTEKADMVAQICKTFGVPLQDLDSRLAYHFNGQGQPQVPNQQGYNNPALFRDPRLDQLLAQQEQQRAYQEQQATYQAQQELEQVREQFEFFDNVKPTMELLFTAAAQQGRDLGWKEAYEAAIRMEPKIQEVLQQREEAQRAKQNNLAKARKAAGSLRPSGPGATSGAGGTLSLRDAINAAIEEHGGI